MEQGYLIDTNAAIDYLNNKLSEETAGIIDNNPSRISVITRMELLGWQNATKDQMQILHQFVDGSVIYNLEEPVILKAIEIRKSNRIKLPDAIIAATALVYQLILITRNKNDFKSISGIHLISLLDS